MAISSGNTAAGWEGQEVRLTLRCALDQVERRDRAGEREKERKRVGLSR